MCSGSMKLSETVKSKILKLKNHDLDLTGFFGQFEKNLKSKKVKFPKTNKIANFTIFIINQMFA